MKKVSIESVTVEEDGGASIYLKDGNLFLGHSIQILLDAKKNVTDVGIVG